MNSPLRLVRKLAALTLLALSPAANTQQADPAATPSYTFHVATDILQIPVLVLSDARLPLPPIDPSRFLVTIAGGAPFRPQVRREGEDPIALAVLVDNSGPQHALLSQLASAMRSALPQIPNAPASNIQASQTQAFHPQDRIMIDSLDHCLLHHPLPPSPPDPGLIVQALARAAAPPTPAEAQERRNKCDGSVKLWDSLAFVISKLARQPGRRVLLVVSNGNDTGSTSTWNQLRLFAGSRAVALFSLSDPQDAWRQHIQRENYRRGSKEADVLSELCQLTGGLSLASTPTDLSQTILDLVAMVRNRYIIEFPRPNHFLSSSNTIEVSVKGIHAFIRSSGISFPLPETPDPSQPLEKKEQPRPIPGNHVTLPPP